MTKALRVQEFAEPGGGYGARLAPLRSPGPRARQAQPRGLSHVFVPRSGAARTGGDAQVPRHPFEADPDAARAGRAQSPRGAAPAAHRAEEKRRMMDLAITAIQD